MVGEKDKLSGDDRLAAGETSHNAPLPVSKEEDVAALQKSVSASNAGRNTDWSALANNPNLSNAKKEFILKLGPAIEDALNEAKKTNPNLNVPAEAVMGQLALESAVNGEWGRSDLAISSNNFAGLTAGSSWSGPVVAKNDKQGEKAGGVTLKQDFRRYDSVDAFAKDYVDFIQKPRYSLAIEQKDPYHYALELGKAGYHNDNDAEYAGYVAKRAAVINPAAVPEFEKYGREYVDVGNQERASRINDAAQQYIGSASNDAEKTKRTREHEEAIAQIAQHNPELGQALTALFALILFVLGEPEKANELLSGTFGESSYGHGNFRESYDTGGPKGNSSYKYNGNGELGGLSQNYKYALPNYSEGQTAGQYFAKAAEAFIGQREVGKNHGAFVDWTMERAGLAGKGEPWCAGFCSKIYEGSGLYNYSASSLNIMEQASSTGSFVSGTKRIDGIEVGDTIVFDRGTTTDYKGHIGIVTGVTKDSQGNVVSVETVEGNKGDKVSNINYSIADLNKARYIGYGDISHRAEKLGINLEEKLRGSEVAPKMLAEEKQQAVDEKAPVPASALEDAAKLTAGLEIKDHKVEGWPPGVDSSVLDAVKAAEASQRMS